MKLTNRTQRLNDLGSAKWAVHIEGKQRIARGEKLIVLSIGEPDAPIPQAIIDKTLHSLHQGRTRYAQSRGEPDILKALSTHYTTSTKRTISPQQFIFLPGTQTALYVALQATVEMGDEVLLCDPYYATYEGVVAAAGGVVKTIPLKPEHGFHLQPNDLKKALTPQTKVLLLNSPSNPTGAVLSAETIKEIGQIAQEANIWMISDEVYASMMDGHHSFSSPFDFSAFENHTLVCSSLSKSHAMPGYRCGWLAGAEPVIAAILPLTETMLFGSQPFLEDAAAFALSTEFTEMHAMKATYLARAQALVTALLGASRIKSRLPEGGMFVMVDIRDTGLTGEEFAWRLLREYKVVTMPGESFGAGGAGHIRIALTASLSEISEAAQRMRALAETLP